jgi:RNA binding exosome subunit
MATFTDFLSSLNSCKQQAVFWHNQTKSFSEHKALENFYSEILELLDGLVESTAGIYGRPMGYTTHEPTDYVSKEEVMKYFKTLYDYIATERKSLYQETWIQNQIDEIAQLVAETLYLLTLV